MIVVLCAAVGRIVCISECILKCCITALLWPRDSPCLDLLGTITPTYLFVCSLFEEIDTIPKYRAMADTAVAGRPHAKVVTTWTDNRLDGTIHRALDTTPPGIVFKSEDGGYTNTDGGNEEQGWRGEHAALDL